MPPSASMLSAARFEAAQQPVISFLQGPVGIYSLTILQDWNGSSVTNPFVLSKSCTYLISQLFGQFTMICRVVTLLMV